MTNLPGKQIPMAGISLWLETHFNYLHTYIRTGVTKTLNDA